MSKVTTTICAQKWCRFHISPRAFEFKKINNNINKLRPKMTKTASSTVGGVSLWLARQHAGRKKCTRAAALGGKNIFSSQRYSPRESFF